MIALMAGGKIDAGQLNVSCRKVECRGDFGLHSGFVLGLCFGTASQDGAWKRAFLCMWRLMGRSISFKLGKYFRLASAGIKLTHRILCLKSEV